jgi:hypothetical protein
LANEYETALGAFEALESAGNQPEAPEGAPEGATVEPSQPEVPASKSIDISGLPEEAQVFIRAREREMQADYTRKTQEVAAQRAEAEQAMQFIQALNSDPQFAGEVLSHLQGQLAAAGYQFEASDEYEVDEWGQQVEPDPYAEEIADLKQWRAQMEDQWVEANLSASLDRQLSVIQAQHPDWGDSDMQAIIDLGFATQGDLMAAAEQYQAVQDQILARYLQGKSSVNTPSPLPSAPANQVPQQPRSEEELRSAAMEIIRANLG